MLEATFLVFPHQLYEDTTLLEKHMRVVLIEEPMLFYDPVWRPLRPNKMKVAHMRACMRYYFEMLKNKGTKVTYLPYERVLTAGYYGIRRKACCYDVTDHGLEKKLKKVFGENISFFPTPNFLISRDALGTYSSRHTTPRHATFFEFAKSTLGVLKGVKSQDALNRLPPPKPGSEPAFDINRRLGERYDVGAMKGVYEEAIVYAASPCFQQHVGDVEALGFFPVCSRDAYAGLTEFLAKRLKWYGPFQDAIVEDSPFMFHSAVSPSLNNGLLDPRRVLTEVMSYEGKVPLNSLEGLVRQLIGWREYMRYIYITRYDTIKGTNLPDNHRRFKDIGIWYKGETGVRPLDVEIKKAASFGYAHHIIRLMIFMNFFILCEIHPDEIYKWFMEVVSLDAYDWVMVSNIYAMGYFDRGAMRKPYISTSNYVLKMSNYKKDGSWEVLWNSLFYRFVAKKPGTYVGFYKRLLKGTHEGPEVAEAFLKRHTVIRT